MDQGKVLAGNENSELLGNGPTRIEQPGPTQMKIQSDDKSDDKPPHQNQLEDQQKSSSSEEFTPQNYQNPALTAMMYLNPGLR